MVLMLGTCVLFHSHLVAIFEAQALDRFAHRLLPISSLQSNPNRTEIHSWPSHAFWSNDWDTYWEYYMGKSEPERNHPIVLYFTNKSENIFGNTEFEEKTSTWLNVLAALHKEFSRGPETHQLAMNVPVIIVSESKPRIHVRESDISPNIQSPSSIISILLGLCRLYYGWNHDTLHCSIDSPLLQLKILCT